MIDVNGLNETNDTKGHAEGDRILCDVSNKLSETFINAEIVYLGGDEFLLISEKNLAFLLNKINDDFCYGCYRLVAKTHRLAYGMKATFLQLDFNIE